MKKHPWTYIAITATAALGLMMAGGVAADDGRQSQAQPMLLASETMEKAGDAVSDTWITSKVKSTFLADSDLDGMDIKVETTQGVVSLSGTVSSEAEKELAIQKTRSIKGVKDVSADALMVAD
ncbi:BON domain-containing protein [Azotobacter chroococcum]|jgi:hyperosmotically inducible protein|uniref:Osmotically-inducible protein Y n=2 Tax=Azotobacter chroococcum TaxID=353 RepID=A0A0C4WGP3_9GAMM|nr:BON domain-containing protein [Azotobacter chroococcum]AJE20243.1 Transport-associated protein [Azotobacter chroococcum NCIMB 8003]ASL25511.1 phospholipid-binding protein [Azotobacter chroococcum]QQE89518.1 BON domain-containing protein [Azotobacter chroococcum]TBW03198.1 BON domain-containing protein [Azotobacter chroococcum]TBW39140.1 BON domain-containing protein [Azotobacter chroococcum]